MDDTRLSELRRFWDQVARGEPAIAGDLDPEMTDTIRRLHASDGDPAPDPLYAARLRERLMVETSAPPSRAEPLTPPGPDGWVVPDSRRAIWPNLQQPRGRQAAIWLATAALLLLVLAGSFLALGPRRWSRQDDANVLIPAVVATPATPVGLKTETLLDSTVAALPEGRVRVAVDRWRLQPSPSSVTLPAHEGVVLLTVDAGEVAATAGGNEHLLQSGDTLDVTNQEFAFRASGSEATIAYAVYVTPDLNTAAGQSHMRVWLSGDPLVHAHDFVISASADDLPGGPGRVLVERITLPPGSALPPVQADPLVWTEVGRGTLGLTLEGDRLPFRWRSGTERKFPFGGDYLPQFLAPGTTMKMRNAADEPLVLYRMSIVPGESGATGTAAPVGAPQPEAAAVIGTPATPVTLRTETLLDTIVSSLPTGRNMVVVDRWRLQPSPKAVTLSVHEGTVLMAVESGEITVTVNGIEYRLEPGAALDVANHEFAFRASGSEPAIAYAIYVTPRFPGYGANRFWLSGDPLVHASDGVISSSYDNLSGGPGRLVLERLTVPPGGFLPPLEASPSVWTEVGSGILGLTLDGERLPYGWESGAERKYFQFGREILPRAAPGTTMKMRNLGDEPLVLYRLELILGDVGTLGTGAINAATPSG